MEITRDPWVFGRFPLNLRPARYWSSRLCFGASLIGNTILITLIKTEKNPVMIPYSRVLLMNVGFDLFYTLICIVTEVEIEFNDGGYILILNGIPKHYSVGWQIFYIWVWQWGIVSVCHVSAVEFIFRYFRVCRNYTMTYNWLAVAALIVSSYAILNSSLLCASIASVPDANATYGHLMTDPIWLEEDGTRLTFHVASMDNIWSKLYIVVVCTEDVSLMSVLMLSSIATLRELASQQNVMSAKVKYMQAQLNRLMFAEFISLISVFAVPIGILFIFLILRVEWVGFGMIIAIAIEWVPAVNPATTIFLVGSYRKALVTQMRQRIFGQNAEPSSVHPSDAGVTHRPEAEATTTALP